MTKYKIIISVFISIYLLIPCHSKAQWLLWPTSPTSFFTTSLNTGFNFNNFNPLTLWTNNLNTFTNFGINTNWISPFSAFSNFSNPFSSLSSTSSYSPLIPQGYGSSISGMQTLPTTNPILTSSKGLCTGITSEGTPICPQYDQYFPADQQATFELKVETDKSNYAPGKSVYITFIVRNTEDLPVLVNYANSKKFEINIIDQDGYEVWSSSHDMRYAQMIISSEFAAKESKSFSEIWDQKDNNSNLVPSGNYTIEAIWSSYNGGSASTDIILTDSYIINTSYGNCKDNTDGLSTNNSGNNQTFRYEYVDNVLSLYHNNAIYNCCIEEIGATMNVVNDVINIYENVMLQGAGCNCICGYDLTISIANLSLGSYTVRFFDGNTGELYGTISNVAIPCFRENEHKVINVEKFKKIRQFIIDQGQRRTYCQMYNDNPYYQFSDNFLFYLNPGSQIVDIYNAPIDEFISITIQVFPSASGPLKYYDIHYDEASGNICVLHAEEEIIEAEKQIDFFFTEALKLIDNIEKTSLSEKLQSIIPSDWNITQEPILGEQLAVFKIISDTECLLENTPRLMPPYLIYPYIEIEFEQKWTEKNYEKENQQYNDCLNIIAKFPFIGHGCTKRIPDINTKFYSIFIYERSCNDETSFLKDAITDFFNNLSDDEDLLNAFTNILI